MLSYANFVELIAANLLIAFVGDKLAFLTMFFAAVLYVFPGLATTLSNKKNTLRRGKKGIQFEYFVKAYNKLKN